MEYIINWPADSYKLTELRSGDIVHLSGTIYTARDAAHRRLVDLLDADKETPVDLRDSAIYYAGPAPCPPGMPCGSIGPTTSGRMDIYKEKMMKAGMKLMIGKGKCFPQLKELCREYKAVYLAAFGGVAALLSMLNSCASGVSVVNIDNGFGAGYMASVINHLD